jgi:type I restriction enzyme, S subunit
MSKTVPAGWHIKNIRDLATLNYGKSPKDVMAEDGSHPVIGTGGITGYASSYLYDGCTTVIGRKGTINKPSYVRGKFWPIDTTYYGTDYKGADPKWFYYTLSLLDLSKYNEASGVPSLSRDTLYAIPLLVPPLPEQKKIATILSCIDDVIEKTRACTDKLKELKTGMMQTLLTKGIGHTEFKDSPVGRIPIGWDVIELKKIAAVKGGKRMPKGRAFADHVTPYPYVRVSDFRDGTVSRDNLRYVLPEDRAGISRYTIGESDLYISIAGTIGLVGSIPADLDGAQLTENAAKIVFHDPGKVCPHYMKFLLSSAAVQERLNQEKGTGGGVPKLALFRIESTLIPLPEFTEQRKIASVLDSIDRRITGDKQKLKNLTKLKKAVMQNLLTGKVRVNVQQKETVAA